MPLFVGCNVYVCLCVCVCLGVHVYARGQTMIKPLITQSLLNHFLILFFFLQQVSFFSTSPELSNKQRFEYFSRTIPSDTYQVKAMVDIVRRMGWSYISIIYEESNYGIKVGQYVLANDSIQCYTELRYNFVNMNSSFHKMNTYSTVRRYVKEFTWNMS